MSMKYSTFIALCILITCVSVALTILSLGTNQELEGYLVINTRAYGVEAGGLDLETHYQEIGVYYANEIDAESEMGEGCEPSCEFWFKDIHWSSIYSGQLIVIDRATGLIVFDHVFRFED